MSSLNVNSLSPLLKDTDSAVLSVANTNLIECLKPEYRHMSKEIMEFLFEDPDSREQQSGYFKVSVMTLV
jgi:hypothetical protein